MKRRIIIFDDNPEQLNGLSMLINMCDDMECVGQFYNTATIVDNIMETQPDLILMDIDMPGGNGISGTSKAKEAYPEIPIMIQTVFEDNEHIFEALRAGANGYILKKTEPSKLINHLRATFNGEVSLSSAIAIKVLQYFQTVGKDNEYQLSIREKEILSHLVNGYSQKMIASNLDISINTVSNHIAKIYDKLQVNSATEAVSLAIRKRLV